MRAVEAPGGVTRLAPFTMVGKWFLFNTTTHLFRVEEAEVYKNHRNAKIIQLP